jgi:hypothetical protein
MAGNQPIKVVYIQEPIPILVRKKSFRSPVYRNQHNNQVLPRPIFTCIDEVYSSGPVSHPALQQTSLPFYSSNQNSSTDNTIIKNRHYRNLILTIIIIIIIVCIIVIIVLLAVFLTR